MFVNYFLFSLSIACVLSFFFDFQNNKFLFNIWNSLDTESREIERFISLYLILNVVISRLSVSVVVFRRILTPVVITNLQNQRKSTVTGVEIEPKYKKNNIPTHNNLSFFGYYFLLFFFFYFFFFQPFSRTLWTDHY